MFNGTFIGIPYWVWAAISAVIAVIYYFTWPRPVNNINTRPVWRHIILRYFHTLTWVFITVSFLVRMAFPPQGETWGDILALTGFGVYLIFLITAYIDRRSVY